MSVEMLLERYGHHHPDHLSGARKAFAKHREAVAGKERQSAKCWSEWQDLNLRPPRPERGAPPCRERRPEHRSASDHILIAVASLCNGVPIMPVACQGVGRPFLLHRLRHAGRGQRLLGAGAAPRSGSDRYQFRNGATDSRRRSVISNHTIEPQRVS